MEIFRVSFSWPHAILMHRGGQQTRLKNEPDNENNLFLEPSNIKLYCTRRRMMHLSLRSDKKMKKDEIDLISCRLESWGSGTITKDLECYKRPLKNPENVFFERFRTIFCGFFDIFEKVFEGRNLDELLRAELRQFSRNLFFARNRR